MQNLKISKSRPPSLVIIQSSPKTSSHYPHDGGLVQWLVSRIPLFWGGQNLAPLCRGIIAIGLIEMGADDNHDNDNNDDDDCSAD